MLNGFPICKTYSHKVQYVPLNLIIYDVFKNIPFSICTFILEYFVPVKEVKGIAKLIELCLREVSETSEIGLTRIRLWLTRVPEALIQ